MRWMRMIRTALSLALAGASVLAAAAPAGNPVDVFDFESAQQEQEYRQLVAEFRCPKCLNTSLLGSDAPIAKDLRQAVYRLAIEEGRTNAEVRDYLQARYGDFVLYSPPLRPSTLVLWFGPLLLLIIGLFWWRRTVRRAALAGVQNLSDDDRARLQRLLDTK